MIDFFLTITAPTCRRMQFERVAASRAIFPSRGVLCVVQRQLSLGLPRADVTSFDTPHPRYE